MGLSALAFSELRLAAPSRRAFIGLVVFLTWGIGVAGPAKLGAVRRAFGERTPLTYLSVSDMALPIYSQAANPRESLLVEPPVDEKIHVDVVKGRGGVAVILARPRLIEVRAECQTDCTLRVGQFYYPAWRAKLLNGGGECPMGPASPGGLMEMSLPSGTHAIQLNLPRDWSERLGAWMSLASLVFGIFILILEKRNPKPDSATV